MSSKRGGRRGGNAGGMGGSTGGHQRSVLINKRASGGARQTQSPQQRRPFQVGRLEDVGPKVVIDGLPAGFDAKEVQDYLRTRTMKPGMVFKGHEYRNKKLYLTLERNDDAQTLANLSSFRYGGDIITITREIQSPAGGRVGRSNIMDAKKDRDRIVLGNKHVAQVEEHLQKEYKDDSPLLNLSYLSATLSINFNESAILRPIFKLISEKCPKDDDTWQDTALGSGQRSTVLPCQRGKEPKEDVIGLQASYGITEM